MSDKTDCSRCSDGLIGTTNKGSFLDISDLDCLARLSPFLNVLSSDPVLHRNRLRVVAPSRIKHSLFAQGCHGTLLRPSVADLVRMNVMKGIGIERRWRLGIYFYSVQVRLLWLGCEVARPCSCPRHTCILTFHLSVCQTLRIMPSFRACSNRPRSHHSSH